MFTVCNVAIDWVATGTMLQGIGTIVGAFAALWAFKTWHKQKITEKKMNHAERILAATYNGEQALKGVRNMFISIFEQDTARKELKKQDDLIQPKEQLVTAYVFYGRLDSTKGEREALIQCLPMAQALFSSELEQAIKSLIEQFWEVGNAAGFYATSGDGIDDEVTREAKRKMYEGISPNKNEVTDAIKSAVKTIKNICLPVLQDNISTNPRSP
ncbi:MAG: hypothetical protein LBV44_01910 [Methylobacillus sp.]|jgi:hypothetical protein|nr:hypothetical protein [Methylobacillus sp.]